MKETRKRSEAAFEIVTAVSAILLVQQLIERQQEKHSHEQWQRQPADPSSPSSPLAMFWMRYDNKNRYHLGQTNLLAFQSDPQFKRALAKTVSDIHGDGSTLRPHECIAECPLHGGPLEDVEQRLGIPATILALSDSLNYALEVEKAAFWYDRFMRSVSVGADLSCAFGEFAYFLFEDKKVGIDRLFRYEATKDLVRKVLATVQGFCPSTGMLRDLRHQLVEFDAAFPDPARMSSECEPAILLIDFSVQPDAKLGSDLLMSCASKFQYGKRGKSWSHLAKTYAEKYLDLLMHVEAIDT